MLGPNYFSKWGLINKRNIWHEMSGGMIPPMAAGIDAAANR